MPDAERALLCSLAAAHPILQSEILPEPVLAPGEFLRQICCWGNLLNLFKTTSAYSGKPQLSRYNPELGYRMCTPEEFWALSVDNSEFGREYDFSRSFFEQFDQLLRAVYWLPLNATNCEGSDYINGAYGAKNSYLCFGIFNSEDCLYSYMLNHCSDCLDCIDALQSQYCYDGHMLRNCYECRHCRQCSNCSQCVLCEDCIGCQNCLLSYGLRNASYCIENQPLTKEQYQQHLHSLELHKRSKVSLGQQRLASLLAQAGHRTNRLTNAEDSTGCFLTNVNNLHSSFYTHNALDSGYLVCSHDCAHCWRGFAENSELAYQSGTYFKAYATYNSYMIVGGSFNLYSVFLYNTCNHCFGCAGLNKKEYCVLNKQYSKQEYFELVPRIIAQMRAHGEWGSFFPPRIAPHYYEQAFCNDWLQPLAAGEAERRGYRVGAGGLPTPQVGVSSSTIADSLYDLSPAQAQLTYVCASTGQSFRFQKKELEFYRKFGIPPPELHWAERIRRRIADVYLIPEVLE
jgi:hypothetical protein